MLLFYDERFFYRVASDLRRLHAYKMSAPPYFEPSVAARCRATITRSPTAS